MREVNLVLEKRYSFTKCHDLM